MDRIHKKSTNLDKELDLIEEVEWKKRVKKELAVRQNRSLIKAERMLIPFIGGIIGFIFAKSVKLKVLFLLSGSCGFVLDKIQKCARYIKRKLFTRTRFTARDRESDHRIVKDDRKSKDFYTKEKRELEYIKDVYGKEERRYQEAREDQDFGCLKNLKDKEAVFKKVFEEVDLYYRDYELPVFDITIEELSLVGDRIYSCLLGLSREEDLYEIMSSILRFTFSRALLHDFACIRVGDLIASLSYLKGLLDKDKILLLQREILKSLKKSKTLTLNKRA